MGVEDSIVTCARTRGSMMKFLPVAALTASAIWVMSASLKLGVMRCACCAEASVAMSAASAHTARERKPVFRNRTPNKKGDRGLLAGGVAVWRFRGRGRRGRLGNRNARGRGSLRRLIGQAVGFLL